MKLTDDFDTAAAKVAGQLSTDPIDTAAREVVDGQRTQAKTSLYNALLANPDMAARAQKLGRQTGIPADVVERNMPEVERNVYLNDFDKILQNSPTVARWLTDQNNARIAHDDVENMGAIESAVRYVVSAPSAPRGGLMSDLGNVGMAAVSGLQRASAGVVGVAQAPFDLLAPIADPLVGRVIPANPLRVTAQGLAEYRQGIEAQAKANMPKAGGIIEAGVYSGFGSLSTNLAALPLALVNPAAGLAAMTLPVGGGAYGEARDKNLSPMQALSFGVSQATIEYATERLPLGKLVGDLKVGAPLYKVVTNQLATEIPGEQLATLLQDLNEWSTLNPEKAFKDYLAERPSAAVQTLVATIVGVGGQVSVVKGLEALAQPGAQRIEEGGPQAASASVMQTIMESALQMRLKGVQFEMAERDAQAITALTDLVKNSKLAQRDPVAFEQFVKQASEDSPVQDVYIDAKIFAQAAQDAGITAEQLPEGVREQLGEAFARGGDVRIPISEFAAQIAPTQYAQSLIDHIKTDPLGMSRAEAQVFAQTQMEDLQAQVEKTLAEREGDVAFKTSIDQVRASFTEQLNTANRFTPEVNTGYANMLANFYAVTAAKVGMTPEQLVERYPLRVAAEGVQGAAQQFDQGGTTRIYHGTTAEAAAAIEANGFDVNKSADGTIWFTSNPKIGEVAATGSGAVVERAFAESDLKLGGWEESDKYSTDELIAMGYDGLKLEDDGETTFQIFKPEKLKRVPVEFNQSATQSRLEQMRAQAQAEYDAVVAQYQGTEQWMRAPNGNPTNLTERQWVQVRTPAFKDWFGDWEKFAGMKGGVWNDANKEVSKVVDDNGEPLVVYHGTDTGGFTRFYETGGERRGDLGIFTTSNRDMAATYVKRGRAKDIDLGEVTDEDVDSPRPSDAVSGIYASFLNLRDVYESHFDGAVWNGERPGQYQVRAENGDLIESDSGSYYFDLFDDANQVALANTDSEVEPADSHFETTDEAVREARKSNNDGAIIRQVVDDGGGAGRYAGEPSDVFVAFDPGSTKSADQNIGTFGTDTDNILLQGTGNRGQIAFGQDITQVPSIITLLKGADLSTFLHESGHFFLEVQMDLASRIGGEAQMFGTDTNTAGQQQILADTAALLNWFGVQSVDEWFNLPMEQKRSYHEQFARGFEAYLFEGKAPSIELQGMFQRFRAWLVRVYKDLKALNVELTDEVRGVMDRMLATTEQIQLAEQGRSMLPLFTEAQQAGMTTEEFAAYQDLGTQSTQDAIEDLQARTLRDMAYMRNARGRQIKRLQKEAAARRAEMQIEARREIMSQPVYRAWQFLTGKLDQNDKAMMAPEPERKSTSGPVDPEVDSLFVAIAKLGGLDRAQVESMWGWDKKERSPQPLFGKPLLRRTDGLGIDAMGEALAEYGYLPKDENGKFDQADLEAKFDAEYRGDTQYAYAKDYQAAVSGEKRAGEDADIENMGAGRFDAFALKDIGLPEQLVQIIADLKMTAKDGIHPDLVAESFGFTSGDELVRTLAIAEAPKVAIEGLTDQKMLEKYGELATPEAIERAADQAIHNDTRARFVATEFNALAKATGQPKVLASAAREYAKVMIDRLLVRNVKPSQYAAAEVRAAKAAEKAMKAGDTAQAAAEKRNQLINTYATKSAHDALTEVEKGLRYLGKFDSEGVRKAIDPDYRDQIDAIRERFDLRTGQSLKSIDKRKSLAKWLTEQEDLGIEVELPEKVTAEAFRQSYKDLSIEEFRGLVDSIKQIEHLGRLKEKLLTAADNRRFADVIASMVNSIEEHAGDKKASNRTRDTLANRAVNLFKGFVASHRKVASLARELDGFQDAGPVWTYLIQSMNTAGDREATMRAEATTRLAEMLKPVLAEGRMGGKGQFFPTVAESLNRGEQLVLALNMGNAGNQQRLLDGRGWTFDQVTPVLQNLSTSDWRFVQSVWDFFESYRPQIAAKERRVMGKEPNWVEPQALTVTPNDGEEMTLRGGYFPIVYDSRESGRAEQQADAEAAKQMMKGAFVAATTRRSFTKSRAEAVSGRPLVLTWDALFRGVNDVIHDLSWHEWVIDANRIVKNEQVDKAIRSTYGADVVQQFKSAIRDIAAGDAPNMDALSKVLTPLRTGAAVAGLGFNLMNAMLQPLGLTQSMVRIGPKYVAQGIAEWAKSPVGLVRQVHEKSEFMRNRGRTQQRELNEIQSVVQGKSEVRQKIDALMFMPMQSLQLVADMPTWWGAYQKALTEAPVDLDAEVAEDRAVKLADQAVLDAQAGGQVKDLALIQRGGPMQKLFTVFYGYFSAAYNLGVERAKATNYRSPLEVMHLAGDFLLLYSVPAVLASLLKSVLTPGGGDDEKELARKLIGEQISYLMGLMVGVREITGAVQYATGTKQFDMAYGGPAGLRFFQELDKLGKQIGQGELDRALARSVVNVGGVLLHLPSGQINRTIDGVVAMSEGKTDNPAALLFGVEK